MSGNDRFISALVDLAREAGQAILEIYGSGDFNVTLKDDESPLTEADRRSHAIIAKGLARIAPDIPVMSEEGRDIPYSGRSGWREFFLVDPLDGTKEFIKRNGEFTVNIGLIRDGVPFAGVVHVPVRGRTYYAHAESGAFRMDGTTDPVGIRCIEAEASDPLIVVASRSHGSEELEAFLRKLSVAERVSSGSALKLCMVAEGSAHIYPRFGPTWEWDTAAGHAVVLAAGGQVVHTVERVPLKYNKEVIKHTGFIAASERLLRGLPA